VNIRRQNKTGFQGGTQEGGRFLKQGIREKISQTTFCWGKRVGKFFDMGGKATGVAGGVLQVVGSRRKRNCKGMVARFGARQLGRGRVDHRKEGMVVGTKDPK